MNDNNKDIKDIEDKDTKQDKNVNKFVEMGKVDPNHIVHDNKYSVYVKHKRRWVKVLGFILLIIVLCFILAYFLLIITSDVIGVGKPFKEIQVNIPQGSSINTISSILEENGVINHSFLFKVFSKLFVKDTLFQYGLYKLNSNMSYSQIVDNLKKSSNQQNTVRITFKEGLTLNDYALLLEENKVCSIDGFLKAINNPDPKFELFIEIKDNELKVQKMEGFAFPNTYDFFINEDPTSVANKFLSEFDKQFSSELKNKMKERNMSLQNVITLASIIQAEAGDIKEMVKVSSVFHNRLNNSSVYPKLQSDPTKKYVEQYLKSTPYNKKIFDSYDTYIGNGLPPGAINNPGIDAIKSALFPEDTPYCYFASNLKTREFYYAKTLAEHNANLVKAGLK